MNDLRLPKVVVKLPAFLPCGESLEAEVTVIPAEGSAILSDLQLMIKCSLLEGGLSTWKHNGGLNSKHEVKIRLNAVSQGVESAPVFYELKFSLGGDERVFSGTGQGVGGRNVISLGDGKERSGRARVETIVWEEITKKRLNGGGKVATDQTSTRPSGVRPLSTLGTGMLLKPGPSHGPSKAKERIVVPPGDGFSNPHAGSTREPFRSKAGSSSPSFPAKRGGAQPEEVVPRKRGAIFMQLTALIVVLLISVTLYEKKFRNGISGEQPDARVVEEVTLSDQIQTEPYVKAELNEIEAGSSKEVERQILPGKEKEEAGLLADAASKSIPPLPLMQETIDFNRQIGRETGKAENMTIKSVDERLGTVEISKIPEPAIKEEERVRALIRKYIRMANSETGGDQGELFAPIVDNYFNTKGITTAEQVSESQLVSNRKWPIREFSVGEDTIKVTKQLEGEWRVDYEVEFRCRKSPGVEPDEGRTLNYARVVKEADGSLRFREMSTR
jgi:hypothetical protein